MANIASSSSSGSGNNVGRKGRSRLSGGLVIKAVLDTMDEPPITIEPVPASTSTNPNLCTIRTISDIGHYSPSTPSTIVHIGDLPTWLLSPTIWRRLAVCKIPFLSTYIHAICIHAFYILEFSFWLESNSSPIEWQFTQILSTRRRHL